MPRRTVKRSQIQPKSRELYTPGPVQVRVIARHVNGESNRKIAKGEAIDRATVSRILSQQEVVQKIAEGQSRLLTLVPKAIAVCEDSVDSNDERLATGTALKILESLQVLGGIEQLAEFAKTASPETDREQQRLLMLGGMMDMMLKKSRRYGMSLPPEFEHAEQELNKQIDGTNPLRGHRRVCMMNQSARSLPSPTPPASLIACTQSRTL